MAAAFASASALPARARRASGAQCCAAPPRRAALWRDVAGLQGELAAAVRLQRFGDAAALRDRIHALRLTDDYVRTEAALRDAVAAQRFLDAARLRDALRGMTPPPSGVGRRGALPVQGAVAGVVGAQDGVSETETNGVVVRAEAWHMPEHDEARGAGGRVRYCFGYRVRITNVGAETVQLTARHWRVATCGGPDSEVSGAGVVGRQPVLSPGETFEYTSACPITCGVPAGRVVGSMRGEYTFVAGDTGAREFKAQVAPFHFVLPSDRAGK